MSGGPGAMRIKIENDSPDTSPGGVVGNLVAQLARWQAGSTRVEKKRAAHGAGHELTLTFSGLNDFQIAAIEGVAEDLPQLAAHSREQRFKARAQALLDAFAPDDPLTESLLKWVQEDARAQEEFLTRVPVLDSKGVAERAGYAPQHASNKVWRWRTAGRVFALKRGGVDLYPAFQFGDDGQPLPLIAELLEILSADATRTDWQNAFWFVSPNSWLRGAAPKDLLHRASDRDSVLQAARYEVMPAEY